MKSRLQILYEDHLEKDDRLWNELQGVLDRLEKIEDFNDDCFKKTSVLATLIHDNNYMMVTLVQKVAEFERKSNKKEGNH